MFDPDSDFLPTYNKKQSILAIAYTTAETANRITTTTTTNASAKWNNKARVNTSKWVCE